MRRRRRSFGADVEPPCTDPEPTRTDPPPTRTDHMPTILSHALVATAAARWWGRKLPARFWTWTAVCAMLPDIDVVAFAFGIPYEDMFGHRGFTHSFFFAAVVGALVTWHLLHPSHPSHPSHPV